MSFIGITAGPLVANRMRRMFGSSSKRLPISVICSARELIAVAAGHDDVLELGALGDVRNASLPAIFGRLERDLLDLVGVDADGVAARAEPAVHRARVEREEQRLVGIAVRQPGHRRVGLLVQRVERRACGWSGSSRDATGMNCRRSGSL